MSTAPRKYFSERERELDQGRFVEVRHLAYLNYKKKDGTNLLKYEETLDNRDTVKKIILQYELIEGIILPDYERPDKVLTAFESDQLDAKISSFEKQVTILRGEVATLTKRLPKKGKKTR